MILNIFHCMFIQFSWLFIQFKTLQKEPINIWIIIVFSSIILLGFNTFSNNLKTLEAPLAYNAKNIKKLIITYWPRASLTFATIRADNLSFVHQEATTNHGSFTFATDKTITMPVTIFKGNKLSSTETWNKEKTLIEWESKYDNLYTCPFVHLSTRQLVTVKNYNYIISTCPN